MRHVKRLLMSHSGDVEIQTFRGYNDCADRRVRTQLKREFIMIVLNSI